DPSHPWPSSCERLLSVSIRAFTFRPGRVAPRHCRAGDAPSGTPSGVVQADLVDPGAPVHKGYAVEFVLEPVEEGVDAGREADRGLACQPLVREAKERTLAVGGELPAYDALLPLREFPPRLDVPLVFEDPRRLPHEDLPRHVILSRAASVVDVPPFARIEVAFQGLERVRPHRLIFRDALVELREALGLDRVDPLLRADGDIDELGVTEYPQVLRDPRLREARKPRNNGPGGPASARK